MGRPVYSHELGDPDFSWLISNFLENHPNYSQLDSTCLPVVLIETGVPKAEKADEVVTASIPESDSVETHETE
jgi:hypothetical protein